MFSAAEYETVLRLLARFYEAIITDSGTGVVHSAMQGSLSHADSLVIVGAPTQDGASRASRTLQWLATHGYPELARDAVVVLSYDRHTPFVDEEIIHEHFRTRCRAVIELPSDRHLATGGLIDLNALAPATRDAALELAATIAEGFHAPRARGLSVHGFRSESGRLGRPRRREPAGTEPRARPGCPCAPRRARTRRETAGPRTFPRPRGGGVGRPTQT